MVTQSNGGGNVLSADANSARCDKVTLLFNLEYDLFQEVYSELAETASFVEAAQKATFTLHHRVLSGDDERGRRKYELDTYGAGADLFLRALPERYRKNISRLDWRVATPVDPRKLSNLYAYIENNGKGRRNLNLFDTRPRQKTEGRHAGGKGLAMGSHKSDNRLVVYKRTGEEGAIEIQITGTALENLIQTARALHDKGAAKDWYESVALVLDTRINTIAVQAGFADVEHLSAYVAPSDTSVSAAAFEPDVIDRVKEVLRSLTPSERKALVYQLGIKRKDIIE